LLLLLYHAALLEPRGRDHRYFATHHTIYDLIAGPLQAARPGEWCDFAVIYHEDRVDVGDIDLLQVHRKL
jgi:hypothetical protein